MKYQIPRGTQDILPDTVKIWQNDQETLKKLRNGIIIRKSVHQFLSRLKYFFAELVNQRISCKRKCIHFSIVVERSLTFRPEGRHRQFVPLLKRKCTETQINR